MEYPLAASEGSKLIHRRGLFLLVILISLIRPYISKKLSNSKKICTFVTEIIAKKSLLSCGSLVRIQSESQK